MALLVAAGSGIRLGGELPKQYRKLGSKSVLAHAVDGLHHPAIDDIQLVTGAGQEMLCREALRERSLAPPVTGGPTRQQSVRNGLEALAARGEDITNVLIHDAARPFLPAEVVDRLMAALRTSDGAVPVLPVSDTLAHGSDFLGSQADRSQLLRVQTPQAFRFDLILAAHRQWSDAAAATDDAQIARRAGLNVACVAGHRRLEKLTYDEDFKAAELLMQATMISRTALGFDVHAFGAGDHLWLGGVRIAHDRGLVGHSDADVALHALVDALLGAVGEGDIGDHFPPGDAQWRGAASSSFVEHARKLVEDRGGQIDHVDVTIICEQPRVGPHKGAIREAIAGLLRIPQDRVSIKATTTERLGFTGRGEGIAVQAAATIRLPAR